MLQLQRVLNKVLHRIYARVYKENAKSQMLDSVPNIYCSGSEYATILNMPVYTGS